MRDTGVGIAADSFERIFLPFEQTGRGHSFGGLGLGLSIANAIVKLHAGTIEAESAGLGHGATFRVRLPGATTNGTSATERSTDAPAVTHPPAGPLRILLVEDHEPTLSILERLLTRAGHTVATASTVAAAREAATRGRFDAVVSDIGLPDGSGVDLMHFLHREHGLSGIALSGYGMEEDLRRSREAGFFMHLVKPVDFAQLNHALGQLPVHRES